MIVVSLQSVKCHSLSLSSLQSKFWNEGLNAINSSGRWSRENWRRWGSEAGKGGQPCEVFCYLPSCYCGCWDLNYPRDPWEPVWSTSELSHLRGMGAPDSMSQIWVGIVLGIPRWHWYWAWLNFWVWALVPEKSNSTYVWHFLLGSRACPLMEGPEGYVLGGR